MQKLKEKIKKCDGSVLIGVIVITAVISISAAGLIGVARNMASAETEARDDTGAFILAESGLNMGMGWLWTNADSVFNSWLTANDTMQLNFRRNGTEEAQGGTTGANGFANNVLIFRDDDVITVVSRVIDNDRRLPYTKELRWSMVYGDGDRQGARFGILLNTHQSRDGLASGFRFHGDMHSNQTISLSRQDQGTDNLQNTARFYGNVTVTRRNQTYASWDNREGDRYRRDAVNFFGIGGEYGDPAGEGVARANDIDSSFRNNLSLINEEWKPKLNLAGVPPGQRHFLGLDATGESNNATGGFLEFGVSASGEPQYRFTPNANTRPAGDDGWITYSETQPLIIYAGRPTGPEGNTWDSVAIDRSADFNLIIADGTMKGRVTVATGDNRHIAIDLQEGRSLVYDGVTVEPVTPLVPADTGNTLIRNDAVGVGENGADALRAINDYVQGAVTGKGGEEAGQGVLANNNNMFSFFSGGNISIVDSHRNTYNDQRDRYITAHLFSTESSRGVVNAPQRCPVTGFQNRDDIRFHVIGSINAQAWGPTAPVDPVDWGGDHWHSANRMLWPYHDKRGLDMPGISYVNCFPDCSNPNNINLPEGSRRFAWREVNF